MLIWGRWGRELVLGGRKGGVEIRNSILDLVECFICFT